MGVLRQQHADLQPLLLAVAQQAGHALALLGQMHGLQQFAKPIALLAAELGPHRKPRTTIASESQLQILDNGQRLEDGGLLELAADARAGDLLLAHQAQVEVAAEEDAPAVGPSLARQAVHRRRLAGAVGTDDAAQLANTHRERQATQRLEAVEGDLEVFDVKSHTPG